MTNYEEIKWHKRYLEIAKQVSTWSKDPSRKIGAVLIGEKGQIISQGYNGFLPGLPHHSIIINEHEIATIHAEQNAIIDCAKRGVSCNESVAYITHYPCLNCAKLLYASGIKTIYYINDYKNDENIIKLGLVQNQNSREGTSIIKLIT